MRKVSYTVRKEDGTLFNTTSYKVATENGNHIVKIVLTSIHENELKTIEELEEIEKGREKYKAVKAKIRIRKAV